MRETVWRCGSIRRSAYARCAGPGRGSETAAKVRDGLLRNLGASEIPRRPHHRAAGSTAPQRTRPTQKLSAAGEPTGRVVWSRRAKP